MAVTSGMPELLEAEAGLAKSASFRFIERPDLRKMRGEMIEQVTSGFYKDMYIDMPYTYKEATNLINSCTNMYAHT